MTTLGDRDVAAAAAKTEARDPDDRAKTMDRSRQGARTVALLGFAAVFALWLVWGYQLVQNLRHIEESRGPAAQLRPWRAGVVEGAHQRSARLNLSAGRTH